MAHKISDDTIEYVAILAKLELSQEEKDNAKADMEKLLDYIDSINELDTDGVEPLSHAFPIHNVFREDEVSCSADRKDILLNAPEKKDSCFKVPQQ